ncbi:MAG: biopolymer transporter ExbD [Lentisphaeria bacterium]|nr:biopolymer transporter ExbD [Lentisphaeria bacterium]
MNRKVRHESKLKAMVEINMTPLMDLTFTLLIVFIITMPILDFTTDVTPPKMTTENKIPEEDAGAIQITLDRDGNCGINGLPVPFSEIENQLKSLQGMGRTHVRIRADGARPYDEIISLIRPAKHCGLSVQLETQGE